MRVQIHPPICQKYLFGRAFTRKSAVDDTIDCGLFNFSYEKALKSRGLRDAGGADCLRRPAFFVLRGLDAGEGDSEFEPSPCSERGKIKRLDKSLKGCHLVAK